MSMMLTYFVIITITSNGRQPCTWTTTSLQLFWSRWRKPASSSWALPLSHVNAHASKFALNPFENLLVGVASPRAYDVDQPLAWNQERLCQLLFPVQRGSCYSDPSSPALPADKEHSGLGEAALSLAWHSSTHHTLPLCDQIHACMHIHTCIHTRMPFIHACFHTCMHSYTNAFIHECNYTCMHSYNHAFILWHACIHTTMHTCIHACIYTNAYTCSLLDAWCNWAHARSW